MTQSTTDTIFAPATPPGRSAVAVIRISGPKAAMAPAQFGASCPAAGQFAVARLRAGGQMIDQVMLLFMQGPKSSTGEDVCEIHCHGSQAVLAALLDRLAAIPGFRMAEPGEFTRRAFAHGKMDLSGVEGLADLIESQTPAQLHQAWAQIDGALRGPVMAWRAELVTLAAELEALIDFADEDLPAHVMRELRCKTQDLITALAGSLDDGGVGELVRDGVTMVLTGPVNAGKSTLLNALAGRPAAIVSDEAGTTRDIVQVSIDLGGVPARLLDTAGIRASSGMIEAEGIRRAKAAVETANLALLVVDGSNPEWGQELARINALITGDRLIIVNKADAAPLSPSALLELAANGWDHIVMSAQNPGDIDRLVAHLTTRLVPHNQAESGVLITRARHRQSIRAAHDALARAVCHDFNVTPELAAEEYRLAATALGRITGEIDVEELLGRIFSAFCIGK